VTCLRDRFLSDLSIATKFWSVRWNALGAVVLPLMQAVPSMPPEVQAMFPLAVRAVVACLWCVIAIYFRVYVQKKLNERPAP
jgi:hypothetical protein